MTLPRILEFNQTFGDYSKKSIKEITRKKRKLCLDTIGLIRKFLLRIDEPIEVFLVDQSAIIKPFFLIYKYFFKILSEN